MDTFNDIIQKRRSVRKFQSTLFSQELLDAVIEAGRLAPSGSNSQSCHFIVIQNPAVITELITIVKEEFAKMTYDETTYRSLKGSISAAQRGVYDFTYKAPVVVVVANRKNYGNAMADSSCAMQNMMLAATACGIGSCWLNQLHWLDENPRVRKFLIALGLDEQETVCASLGLGLPDDSPRPPLPRFGNRVTYIK